MALVLVLSLPFLYVVARKPVLRRLAVRNARRRPRETMLVLLGSLLGTAIITGSYIVGDTLEASIRRSAYTQLGPVDEVVRTQSPEVAVDVERTVRALPAGTVDGTLRILGHEPALVSRRTVDEVFGPLATTNTLLLAVKPGTDAQALAERLNGQFLAMGPTPTPSARRWAGTPPSRLSSSG